MSDLISREALCEYALNQKDKSITPNDIMRFPSAQPKKRTEERTETHGVCLDAIDRQVAINALHDEIVRRRINEDLIDDGALDEFDTEAILRRLPPAQLEIVRCKDCKHWKDSDGVYRRGIGAESKCPVNIRAVYEGNFYCADAERRTDERSD